MWEGTVRIKRGVSEGTQTGPTWSRRREAVGDRGAKPAGAADRSDVHPRPPAASGRGEPRHREAAGAVPAGEGPAAPRRAALRARGARPRRSLPADAGRIVDGSNPQEPVRRYYPGDDLFTPYERRRGLPIGNLTSQLFSNVYLDRFDHFVTDVLRAPYLRCVDDFALFADDPARLEAWRTRAERFLEGRCLSLHPAKTRVAPAAAPAEFLGCVLLPGGRRRLRKRTSGGSATGCAGCATAGAPGRSGGRRWSSASPRGWRTRRTPTRGGCAARSSGTGGSRPRGRRCRGPDRPLSSCFARRFVEQQSAEPPFGQSQQEHHRESERQRRFSRVEHAPMPEPGRSRPLRARAGTSRAGHADPAPPESAASRPAPVLARSATRPPFRLICRWKRPPVQAH